MQRREISYTQTHLSCLAYFSSVNAVPLTCYQLFLVFCMIRCRKRRIKAFAGP